VSKGALGRLVNGRDCLSIAHRLSIIRSNVCFKIGSQTWFLHYCSQADVVLDPGLWWAYFL
jgi:hypothetical protein